MKPTDKKICDFIEDNASKYTINELYPIINEKFGTNYTYRSLLKHYYRHNIKYKSERPWLKGKKSPYFAKSIGEESAPDSNGFVRIKINDKQWKYKSRYIYEQHYGIELPDDYKIMFLDKDRTNFDISNLIAVKQKVFLTTINYELVSKNREITKLGILTAKLINKTKEVSK